MSPETGTGGGSCSLYLGTSASAFAHMSEQSLNLSSGGPIFSRDA
ncbi:MAG TPA: hypothetical protein VFG42_17665 [Baekduia sp.]|nr:hypothetical protein [Baekduia sp.]HET6508625.1 hypothetical protein [Baekduia sp.]